MIIFFWVDFITRHLLRHRPGHTDSHFIYTASCGKTTSYGKTRIFHLKLPMLYENLAIFRRRKLVIVLEPLHLKMKVTVSEHCDVKWQDFILT